MARMPTKIKINTEPYESRASEGRQKAFSGGRQLGNSANDICERRACPGSGLKKGQQRPEIECDGGKGKRKRRMAVGSKEVRTRVGQHGSVWRKYKTPLSAQKKKLER